MGLSDIKKEFIAVRTARGIASRNLFEERAPGALRQAVLSALAEEAGKERMIDEEARRMMEAARSEIASGRVVNAIADGVNIEGRGTRDEGRGTGASPRSLTPHP